MVKNTLFGLLALFIIVVGIQVGPAVARKVAGTEDIYRRDQALELEQKQRDLELQRQKDAATAPVEVAVPYVLMIAVAAALSLGIAVAYDRLYRRPLVKADEHGRLPVSRSLVADTRVSHDQMFAMMLESQRQATAVQIEQARAMHRLADKMSITVKDVTPAPARIEVLPDTEVHELPAPVFNFDRDRFDLLPRLATTGAKSLLLGCDENGADVRGDLNTLMHTGLLAQTGGGKTTTLAAYGLQLASDPNVQIAIADPHMMELSLLEETGAFWRPSPSNAKQAVAILKEAQKEIHRRAELMNKVSLHLQKCTGKRIVLNSIDRYNIAADKVKAERLPALVLFADEIKALAAMSDETDGILQSITAEGRKFGVYFVGASQSWKADVVSTDVRSQFWTRIVLFGAQYRQTAELFEIDQKEAKGYTAQLTSPGCAAIWQRADGIKVVKTPYIDIESDAVYGAMELIKTRRSAEDSGYIAPAIIDVAATATASATGNGNSATERNKPALLTDDLAAIEIGGNRPKVTVSPDERSAIIQAAQDAGSRRAVTKAVFNSTGGAAYDKVKLVLDEVGMLV